MQPKTEKILHKLPDAPGIYLFYNTKKELLYVGKATSLRSRVRSYFRGKRIPKSLSASGQAPRPIEEMIHEVTNIKWKEADSVLEAVILESIYIKKHQPRYNVLGKDNKSWNYIVITSDAYPRVMPMRQHQLMKKLEGRFDNVRIRKLGYSKIFGPFPGLNTKETMKLLRRMFQFSDCQGSTKRRRASRTKKSVLAGRSAAKPCFYYQIGECLGVCTSEISATEYKRKVIQPLVTFLNGGKKRLIKTLEGRMQKASKDEDYEEAARLRDQIARLQRIHDVALLNKNFFELDYRLQTTDYRVSRIEGYDISNLGSSGKVGSMVVYVDGEAEKSEYRKFKIKTVEGQSDVECLEEVLRRRLKHDEWQLPEILLVDGGLPQVNTAKRVLKETGFKIPVVGIAKGPDRKKNEFVLGSRKKDVIAWVSENRQTLVRVRDEAHRFAIAYQRSTRKLK